MKGEITLCQGKSHSQTIYLRQGQGLTTMTPPFLSSLQSSIVAPHWLRPKETSSFQSPSVQSMNVGLGAESRLEKDREAKQKSKWNTSSWGAVKHLGAGPFTSSPPILLISVLLISPSRFRTQQLGTEFLKFLCPQKSKTLYILFPPLYTFLKV